MSLNKQNMVREIGRRTRLPNRDVQRVIETLVELWIEELVNNGRIELENFITVQTRTSERAVSGSSSKRVIRQIKLKVSRKTHHLLNPRSDQAPSASSSDSS